MHHLLIPYRTIFVDTFQNQNVRKIWPLRMHTCLFFKEIWGYNKEFPISKYPKVMRDLTTFDISFFDHFKVEWVCLVVKDKH